MAEIVQQLGALFMMSPVLSIILLTALAAFIIWILRDVLKDVFRAAAKKWFNLNDETEIRTAVQKAIDERTFYDNVPDKLTPDLETRVITHLRNPK